jgi:hypothetical protein
MARLRLKNLLENTRFLASLNLCADDPRVAMIVNEFELQALPYGRWWGTTQLIQVCNVSNGCLVLPRGVATVEAVSVGCRTMRPGNIFGDFLREHLPWSGDSSCSCCGCSGVSMSEGGLVPAFNTTTGTDSVIRAYPGNAADVGKKIIIQGEDANGVWVRTLIDGVMSDGEEITLALPFVDTVTVWGPGAPMAVMKEITSYPVQIFAVDQSTTVETQLAEYQPTETEPEYRRVYLQGACGNSCSSLKAVVSLDQVTIRDENDWLLFHNLEAYRQGMKSIIYRDEGNQVLADAYFFGTNRGSKNGRGVLRYAEGMGALPILRAELRKHTGDRTEIAIQHQGLDMRGFM